MALLSAFPVTPADADGRVDVGALRVLVARLVAAEVGSIGLLGSTGTYAYLTRAERRRALEAALAETGGRVPILVGVGALRTDDAVRLAQDARGAGAAAGLLAPVSYTPLTDDEVFAHFSTVARESALPITVYDNPGTTHFRFSPELVGRLSRVDGIVAVKAPAPGREAAAALVEELRAAVRDGFSVGFSGDADVTETLIAGGEVWYSVIGGLLPEPAGRIVAAVRAGDAAAARAQSARLEPLWSLFRELSSLRVMYACADILGLVCADPPRPILPLAPAARARVAAALAALGLG